MGRHGLAANKDYAIISGKDTVMRLPPLPDPVVSTTAARRTKKSTKRPAGRPPKSATKTAKRVRPDDELDEPSESESVANHEKRDEDNDPESEGNCQKRYAYVEKLEKKLFHSYRENEALKAKVQQLSDRRESLQQQQSDKRLSQENRFLKAQIAALELHLSTTRRKLVEATNDVKRHEATAALTRGRIERLKQDNEALQKFNDLLRGQGKPGDYHDL